jgi:hypothetical protein
MVMQQLVMEGYFCSICGQKTEWDYTLGPNPLCVNCWDKQTESWNPAAAYKRAYRQEHKDEVAAYQRAYYQEHKDEVAAHKRAYYQEHKDEVAAHKRKEPTYAG